MFATFLLVLSLLTVDVSANGPAYWIEGETYYAQTGSVGQDLAQFAVGGECLGSNWGAQTGHSVVYRFYIEHRFDAAVLCMRYARLRNDPAFFDVYCNENHVVERWTLESTGGWGHQSDEEWRYSSVNLGTLETGWNDVKIVSLTDNNNSNLDGFFIAESGFQPPVDTSSIPDFPRARVRGRSNAPTPDWVDADLTLADFSGKLDDWYYPREELTERAALTIPRLVSMNADKVVLTGNQASTSIEVAVGETFAGWSVVEVLTDPEPITVIEREFDRWGLIVYLNTDGVVAEVRKAVGRLDSIERPHTRFPKDYFQQLLDAKEDVLAAKVLGMTDDPGYEDVAGYLAPLHSYTFLGTPESKKKYTVQPDGAIGLLPNQWGANKALETTFFDPHAIPELTAGGIDPRHVKMGGLGGYLPAVNYGFWSSETKSGWELCALMEPGTSGTVFIRTRCQDGRTAFFRLEPFERLNDGRLFFAALLQLQRHWKQFFDEAIQLQLADRRVDDACRAAIVLALSGYAGLHPRYGMGGYWGSDDLHDGFPPTTLSMGNCLLEWGLIEPCKERLGYYLDHFVKDDGTFNYYGPAVAEYGQLLDLAATYVRRTGDTTWFDRYCPVLNRVAGYLLQLRQESLKTQTPDAVSYGLLFGGAEADTAKDVAYYFSGSVWSGRGLRELGAVYSELGQKRGDAEMLTRGREFAGEAESLRRDVLRAAEHSVIRTTTPPFLPPFVGMDEPFLTMTQDHLASYTNYRYWPEALSARCFTSEQDRMILDYHAAFGGELLGTIRFIGHLDDWPFWHQAYSLMAHDRASAYQLAYYSHLAHHQMPGTFTSYEQVQIQGYAYRHEVADYCVPAQLTIPMMTRWMLVWEERDTDELWLLRAAPRAWLQSDLSCAGVPTRWGPVSLHVKPSPDLHKMEVHINLKSVEKPAFMLRLRHPQGWGMLNCEVQGGQCVQIDEERKVLHLKVEADEVVVKVGFSPENS